MNHQMLMIKKINIQKMMKNKWKIGEI
jgi:hypothetical protein